MKKQTITKIISSVIIFVFVVSIFQFASPAQAVQGDFANTGVLSDLYSNPNQNGGKNPYKFALASVLKSGMLQQVIGCTGVVNKVATWMAGFIQSPAQAIKMAEQKIKQVREQLAKACNATKAGTQAGLGTVPLVNDLVTAASTIFNTITMNGSKPCADVVNNVSDDQITEAIKQTEKMTETTIKEQCLDGIAITLAKNQLTAMTRSAMNWVNSGYGGNPFFVQSMTNLTTNIERNVLETGTDILLNKAFGNPYASGFATSAVTAFNSGSSLRSGATNFLSSLTSDLGNFITDPASYYTNSQLTALERAQRANDAFANDFSTGGWNAWLALTQKDANNPLGFAMQASQYLADQQAAQIQGTNNELLQNNGFLSQKTCVSWYMIDDETGEWVYETVTDPTGELGTYERQMITKKPTEEEMADPKACAESKIITPGSIIKDKTTNYLNSPERQLELAKTINDSLNALFSVLISKLEGGGLSGLSDNVTKTNWTDNLNTFTSPDGNTPYNNNGAYDGFNLTRDLGNTYIYDTPILLGTWNAKVCPPLPSDQTNCNTTIKKTPDPTKLDTDYPPKDEANKKIKLYPDSAPEVYQVPVDGTDGKIELLNDLYGDLVNPINGYYTVTTAGKTKLINEGYNGWAIGDRAFWDGSNWQNWKVGQSNPIKQRGVIQIQQDYIVAAKEILGVLPNIMPKLGELDYCLPGPNPSYKTNSTDAQSAYQDWIGSMYVGIVDTTGDRNGVKIDKEGDRTYENFKKTYTDNPEIWKLITTETQTTYNMPKLINIFSNICNDGSGLFSWGRENCDGYYFWENNGKLTKEDSAHLAEKTSVMTEVLDYVNNYLFQDFYKAFDQKMNELYFTGPKSMTSKYSDNELIIGTKPNLAYVEMAAAGLDLTKNMMYYNDDIIKATNDYTDAIAQAKMNIAKLEPIRNEVSGIIKVAQDRRDANLILQINKEGGTTKDRTDICKSYLASCGSSTECKTTYNACIGSNGKDLTIDLYKKIYASCLAEENISFYDPEQITGNTESGNCNDGIDNDLNGLVDKLDPVCPGYVVPTNAGRSTPRESGGREDSGASGASGGRGDSTNAGRATPESGGSGGRDGSGARR